MPKSHPDIEQDIIRILSRGSILQSKIDEYFPLDRYTDVGNTVRDMAARGLLTREKEKTSYVLRLNPEALENNQ